MPKTKRFCLLFFVQFILMFNAFSQEEGLYNQYWLDIIPHFRISDKLEFYGDGSIRALEEGNRKIVTIRPSLRFQVGPILSIHAGIGLFYNHLTDTDHYLEIRPFEAIRIGWPNIGPLKFKHYIRFEQRYFNFPNYENELLHRGRYRIKAKMPLNKKTVQQKTLYIPFSFEWLATANDEISVIWASQSRAMLGVGYILNETWMFEFEYMHLWSKDLPSEQFQASDQVFRLKFLKSGWILGE